MLVNPILSQKVTLFFLLLPALTLCRQPAMAATITYTSDWSTLPEHLLASIAKRFHTRFDILRFRAVCRLFRSILPLPPKIPKILFNTHFFRGLIPYVGVPYFLSECTVYAIQPLNNETSQRWLVKIKESKPGTNTEIMRGIIILKFLSLMKRNMSGFDWVRVVDRLELEDRVIFLSGRSSCSVSAKEFSGWKGNCVYLNVMARNMIIQDMMLGFMI